MVVGLDQLTKQIAIAAVERGEPVNVFFGFEISNVRNSGIAFGALQGSGTVIARADRSARWALLSPTSRVNAARPGLWLPVGAAARRRARQPGRPRPRGRGDRLHRPAAWPAFNLADICIVVGVLVAASTSPRCGPASRSRGDDRPPQIAFEDDHLLVVDKPAGLVVHPAAGHRSGTLVELLAGRLAGGPDRERPGVVHRLDRDTSGLMLVAQASRPSGAAGG